MGSTDVVDSYMYVKKAKHPPKKRAMGRDLKTCLKTIGLTI